MQHSELIRPMQAALHEFEEAIKKHEHHSLFESEILRRQEVDRAREHVIEKVLELLNGEPAKT